MSRMNEIRIHPSGCITRRDKSLGGYGHMRHEGRQVATHRLVYAAATGTELDPTKHIHHTCGNPGCVNPEHLVMLTPAEHKRAHAAFHMMMRSHDEFGTPKPTRILVNTPDLP